MLNHDDCGSVMSPNIIAGNSFSPAGRCYWLIASSSSPIVIRILIMSAEEK